MEGLLEEARSTMEDIEDESVLDVGMIINAQKVEHYEIAAYTTARTLASQLGLPAVTELLNASLGEEQVSDSILTQIAREFMSQARTGIAKRGRESQAVGGTDE